MLSLTVLCAARQMSHLLSLVNRDLGSSNGAELLSSDQSVRIANLPFVRMDQSPS